MVFKKLRIIQAGLTTNFGETEGETLPLSITDSAVQSVVTLGNEKPIHCRRTHNGADMLDGYLGKFTNFVYENGVAYADFHLSEALETAYPSEAKFISTMIQKETDMLGVSVIGANNQVKNGNVIDVMQFTDLYSCDIVGLPAATTSLFSKNQKESKMNKFFSAFASVFKAKSSFATETVQTKDGSSITIEAAGETMAIGDKVFDSEGNAIEDGEITIVVDGSEAVLEIEGGAIKEVKAVEETEAEAETAVEEMATDEETKAEEKTKEVPEEFSAQIAALSALIEAQGKQITELKSQFSKASKIPTVGTGAAQVQTKGGITKLSKDAVQEAAKKYRNK
ncbi:hypothetical protein BM127P2_00019 [Phocaeicola phage BM127P2]|nr:hypothetical protein BM127P1_00004 [Phocaeicola phage BM127P1]WAX08298.1 hypothetical protein BM127P2_00019 [Phocaeicola phage BM127P2]WAX08349.1 hypothetical protein BM127P3_00023 [Phocaeicola phage BM127P3]WAX08392.1 hypothetical protein BM127P4_00019 [Phocaeicola phage BM127P4]